MFTAKSYAAQSAASPLAPFEFSRRSLGAKDVLIEIAYCGVCHSDLHQARGEWGNSVYPMVPGHEIVGTVKQVGSAVGKFKLGDRVGIGCFVDSCRECECCKDGIEQYCDKLSQTYNSLEQDGQTATQGGYSDKIVVDEKYVLSVPANLELSGAAPLLCAGITTYSPLRYWKVGPGQKVAISGLGGLGHMGVKFASALGADVTVLSTSRQKQADALRLGAKDFQLISDESAMSKLAGSFDFILNTVSAKHDISALLNLLKLDGTLHLVGGIAEPLDLPSFPLLMKRRKISGSIIGGIKETQEMLDFCGAHNIVSDIELIPMSKINEAYGRILKSDVKYRFVIDMATL